MLLSLAATSYFVLHTRHTGEAEANRCLLRANPLPLVILSAAKNLASRASSCPGITIGITPT